MAVRSGAAQQQRTVHAVPTTKAMCAPPPSRRAAWMTPALLQRIMEDPVLLKGMSNPRFASALEELQRDPAAAASRYEVRARAGVLAHGGAVAAAATARILPPPHLPPSRARCSTTRN